MRISDATAKATKYACINFHYAKSVPSAKFSFNIFNDEDEWCGVIVFGNGATINIGSPFGLAQGEILELVRVALNGKQGHGNTSRAVALALKELHKKDPIVKLVVSYADKDQDHAGTIYQATNWIYLGQTNEGMRSAFIVNGKKTHPKTIGSRGWVQSIKWIRENIDPNAQEFFTKGKHKYIFCFDKKERKKWEQKREPYPKGDSNGSTKNNMERTTV